MIPTPASLPAEDARSSQYRQPTEAEAEAETRFVDPNDPDEIMRKWREGEKQRRQEKEEEEEEEQGNPWYFQLNGVRGG